MFRLTSFCLYALAAFGAMSTLASPTHMDDKRSITAIQTDLSNIASRISTIQNTANLLPTSGALPASANAVVQAIKLTSAAVQLGTTDTTSTAAFTDAQAIQLLNAFNTLIPSSLQSALATVDSKKAVFLAVGYKVACNTAMVNLKSDFHAFTGALIAKTPTAELSQATAIQTNMDTIIQNAINAFA